MDEFRRSLSDISGMRYTESFTIDITHNGSPVKLYLNPEQLGKCYEAFKKYCPDYFHYDALKYSSRIQSEKQLLQEDEVTIKEKSISNNLKLLL